MKTILCMIVPECYSSVMALDIRPYTSDDHEGLVAMATGLIDTMSTIDPQHLFRSRGEFDASGYIEARLQKVLDENGVVYIAFADGQPAGYLMATIEETLGIDALNKFPIRKGVIDALFVSDVYRGQGIAAALLEKIEEYFKSKECGYSEVSCLAVNDAARKIYSNKGYQERYIDFLKQL